MPDEFSQITDHRALITLLTFIMFFISLPGTVSPIASAQQGKKPFTVADDIEFSHFGVLYTTAEESVQFSPDGNYFAVDTVRGRLDLNRVEGSLRFYRSRDVEAFLRHPAESQAPLPVWVANRSEKQEPVFKKWRWVDDSSGVAFLGSQARDGQSLMLADLRRKAIEPLISITETIDDFDVRNRQCYVYTATDWTEHKKKINAERRMPKVVGTGRQLIELLLPDDPITAFIASPPKYLWAVVSGKRFQVMHSGAPLVAGDAVAMSPDGHSLVTSLPVAVVPPSWERLYPPPFASAPSHIHPGGSAKQYVRIDLQTGFIQALTDAPTGNDAGWGALGNPSWSSDGHAIVLSGTFLRSKENTPTRPCIAVVDLRLNIGTCVEMLKGHTENGEIEEGYHLIWGASFADGDQHRVKVTFMSHEDQTVQTIEYQQSHDRSWHVIEQEGLDVDVKQWFNEPPRLVATEDQVTRTILDPNPQLKDVDLGEVSIYTWKDKEGRQWKGGLYKPTKYKQGQRYPLVIQTHGFNEGWFLPSGGFPTAFAARALAATGIMVLQIAAHGRDSYRDCVDVTPEEGPCAVSMAESAANQLVSEGSVDPDRIGIIGFSRTCFQVMEMLTKGSLHLKAASITDGFMFTYSQYMVSTNRVSGEANTVIGASPFGEGLQQWLKRSPGFNLDKVNAPLLVVGEGPLSLLWMWEPYAALHYLNKPVELMLLNTEEHVLTNPAVRTASQGGSVDWFRFWLQDYEDPNPAKEEQYERWRELRKLQAVNEKPTTP
jgi:dipeptidyl aminopeptidase/acylaminoacyl peptidase